MNAVVIVAAACGLIMFICGICIGILAIKSSSQAGTGNRRNPR